VKRHFQHQSWDSECDIRNFAAIRRQVRHLLAVDRGRLVSVLGVENGSGGSYLDLLLSPFGVITKSTAGSCPTSRLNSAEPDYKPALTAEIE
jgi:hypothetical protein